LAISEDFPPTINLLDLRAYSEKKQIGKSESEEILIAKECSKYLRYYLVEAANSLRVHSEVFRPFYQKKYLEVNKQRHKRELVLTARKLVGLVFALFSKNQYYSQYKGLTATPAKK
jgi:hypothetical protein